MVVTLPGHDSMWAPAPSEPPDPVGPPIPMMRPAIGDDEAAAAAAVVRSGWMAQGLNVATFERAFAELVGAEDAIALANGTSPMHLSLVVLGVRPGDHVVVPSFSYNATTNAVLEVGARPVFADVDIETGNVTPATVSAALTDHTTAVIVVHQSGVPADLDALHAMCGRRGVAVVEDAASALGSTYRGRALGGHADLVTFSFDPLQLVTTGEGGMITTASEEWADRLRRVRDHGVSMRHGTAGRHGGHPIEGYVETGFTGRMTDIQAAIGLAQLGRLDELVARRRELAARYQDGLADVPALRAVADPWYGTTNYQSFWILLDEWFPTRRDDLVRRLAGVDIASVRGIMAAHLDPDYTRLATRALPVTERLTNHSLTLPLYHDMTDDDQDRVIEVIRRAGFVDGTE